MDFSSKLWYICCIYKKHMRKKLNYTAIFEPSAEGGFDVSFPDFPGCVTFGNTFEEAEKMAKDVLNLWLEELTASNEEFPINKSSAIIANIEVSAPLSK